MFNITDFAGAIGSAVFVMMVMMMGSAVGEEVSGFFFKKIRGGMTQILYMLFFLPLFVLGGYVYTLWGVPQTSVIATALFFGLWGFATVFMSRFLITVLGKMAGIRMNKPVRNYINGTLLIKYLKEKKMSDNDIRNVLINSCESKKKAIRLFEGGSEWVDIDPEALCYELAKRGYSVHEVMDVLKGILRMRPEDAAVVWRNASA